MNVIDEIESYLTSRIHFAENVTEQPKMLVGGFLTGYQLKGLQWLVSQYNNKINGILADEMGLGKNIQVISLLAYLIESKQLNGPFMIVAPLSILQAWSSELERWVPKVSKVVYTGNPQARKQLQEEFVPGNFIICLTTFDFVTKDEKFFSKIMWNYMILDEGYLGKSKFFQTVCKQFQIEHRLILTATPLRGDLPSLWNLLNFLHPSSFNRIDVKELSLQQDSEQLCIRLLKVFQLALLRRLKCDVEQEVPRKVEKVILCDMSAIQKKMYNDTLNSISNLQYQLGSILKLRTICNHPYLALKDLKYPMDRNLWRASGKFHHLNKILPKLIAAGHKILLYTQTVSSINLLSEFLSFKGIQFLRMDGSTPTAERIESVTKFNNPDLPYTVFLLSTRAGGRGINMHLSDTVIMFDSDTNPESDLLAQSRAHRIGSNKPLLVIRLVSINSIEYKLYEKSKTPLDEHSLLISSKKTGLEQEPTREEEINCIIARNENERTLFQKMDEEREQQELASWKDEGNTDPLPPPLTTETELPEWYLKTLHQTFFDT
uniref:Helicase ATP-binding domain-containing protein n=1 Tax=Arcella intermedia TaxID=1963864 RepID=A0A6B2L0P5_9EUKA